MAAEWAELSDLTPWGQNPRVNDHVVDEVAASIKRFGFASPIIARRADGEVIAGHTRLKAAQKLGLDRVPVRWMDLDPAEARLLALADNKLNERADWDDGLLSQVLRELERDGADLAGLGWDSEALDALLKDPVLPVEPSKNDDDAPEVQDGEPDSQSGQVYELGPHRLVCGDSTDPEVWAALMGDEKAEMVWTDPPYGVAYVGRTRGALTIQNDDLDEAGLERLLRDSLGLALAYSMQGGAWYVAAPPGPLFWVFGKVLRDLEVWRHTLTWVKDVFVLSRCDYHYRHESIFYGWVPGSAHYFVDDRTQDTVLECPWPRRSAEHPTMKPVDLVRRCIQNSSKPGWVILEPFGGSGTTLIAAAAEGRIARLIELDPKYCDVIRRRWTRWSREHGRDAGPGALE